MPAATVLQPSPSPRERVTGAWTLTSVLPPGWQQELLACGGGFFHSPAALSASLPAGTPVFARLRRGGGTAAVALGVASRCRLALHARHLHFAAPPAAAPGFPRDEAVASLVAALAGAGAAEVSFDAFGSAWWPEPDPPAVAGRERREYVVSLRDGAELSRTHRRHVARGEREGWTVRALPGDAAVALLASVQEGAAERASRRGDRVTGAGPAAAAAPPAEPGPGWGSATWAAFDGDTPLAAALVGWAGGHAFYLMGGSTPEGYRRSASAWLHWTLLRRFGALGFASYNLGGAPAEAEEPAHPAHGLHRFKAGFGAVVTRCRGVRWPLDPAHLRLHRWAGRVAGRAA